MSVGRNYFEMERQKDRLNAVSDNLNRMAFRAPDQQLNDTVNGIIEGCLNDKYICYSTMTGAVVGGVIGAPGGIEGLLMGVAVGGTLGFFAGCCISKYAKSKENPPTHIVQKKQITKERS
jgi:hypothetical protein